MPDDIRRRFLHMTIAGGTSLLVAVLTFLFSAVLCITHNTQLKAEAPSDSLELADRIAELRLRYAPYLKSLPEPLPRSRRQDLSGDDWQCRHEIADADVGETLDASDWHLPGTASDGWSRTTVPQWRYNVKEKRFSRSVVIWYRKSFLAKTREPGNRVWLCFHGVDWQAEVFLNGHAVGTHRVYHEPFRFDVTQQLVTGRNTLAVRVTSGPAFDEPAAYWSLFPVPILREGDEGRYVPDRSRSLTNLGQGDSHVGDGYGIHRNVYLETTGPVHLDQVFARWKPNEGGIQITIEADAQTACQAELSVTVMPENFLPEKATISTGKLRTRLAPKRNTIAAFVPLERPAQWSPETPRLYRCRVHAEGTDRAWKAARDVLFGAREFRIVTQAEATPSRPEGMFLLNDRPCQLRGTNIQGLNALWYWGEHDRLHDVLLHLKAANFNAVRSCQHVCFPEVRELLDRFGIMSQQDQGCRKLTTPSVLPHLLDAVKALNRETYNNPGVVLLSYGNECDFDVTPLIEASVSVDPDRVSIPISGQRWGRQLKPIVGRETNPTLPEALWDHVVCSIHPYWGWYGRMGDLPATAQRDYPLGRMQCVGEYGSEAMDHYPTMQQYPNSWGAVPAPEADELWGHVQVIRNDVRQLAGSRGVEQTTLMGHIRASQTFQGDQLHELTRSWRLMDKQVNGYFQFHFVDLVPANWPKSILSHDLRPKSAYFVMAMLNQPLAPMVEINQGGRTATLWIANSTGAAFSDTTLRWQVLDAVHEQIADQQHLASLDCGVTRVATIELEHVPETQREATFALGLFGPQGRLLAKYRHTFFIRSWRD